MPAQESGHQARPAAAVPAERQPDRLHRRQRGTDRHPRAQQQRRRSRDRAASHFSVYDNTLSAPPALASYPAGFPGQYTVAAVDARGRDRSRRPARSAPAGARTTSRSSARTGSCAGSPATPPRPARRSRWRPSTTTPASSRTFVLNLVNGASSAVNFTVTTNRYGSSRPVQFHVPAGKTTQHNIDPLTISGRLVRPDGHDRRRLVVVTAIHRPRGERPGEHHGLTWLVTGPGKGPAQVRGPYRVRGISRSRDGLAAGEALVAGWLD